MSSIFPPRNASFTLEERDVAFRPSVPLHSSLTSDAERLGDALADRYPVLSTDGKWIAYSAVESGASLEQVFVQPWPALDRKWKISTDGGSAPAWTRGGPELVYMHALASDSTGTPSRVMATSPVAKDGADLPLSGRIPRPARQAMGMGETYDFEFTPERPGNLRLELRRGGQLAARTPIRVY